MNGKVWACNIASLEGFTFGCNFLSFLIFTSYYNYSNTTTKERKVFLNFFNRKIDYTFIFYKQPVYMQLALGNFEGWSLNLIAS